MGVASPRCFAKASACVLFTIFASQVRCGSGTSCSSSHFLLGVFIISWKRIQGSQWRIRAAEAARRVYSQNSDRPSLAWQTYGLRPVILFRPNVTAAADMPSEKSVFKKAQQKLLALNADAAEGGDDARLLWRKG